jgi:hypothetical protein
MRFRRILFVSLLGMAPALAVHGFTAASVKPRAEVLFFEPGKFTDLRASHMASDADRDGYLEQLRDHLLKQARHYVPEGCLLTVTFTDIDMAGDFEPWLGPRWDDVRIVKDIYPPRIELSFQVTDTDGNVLAQGQRKLRDLGFMMKIRMASDNDPLRHEKGLIDDWLRAEFPRGRRPATPPKP